MGIKLGLSHWLRVFQEQGVEEDTWAWEEWDNRGQEEIEQCIASWYALLTKHYMGNKIMKN